MQTCRAAYAVGESLDDPERPCGLRAACHVLPPALAAAPPRIARLGVPIALEKGAEAIVAPDIVARPARHKAALGLVVQHRDELGAIVGLAAQRLARGDDPRSQECGRRRAVADI